MGLAFDDAVSSSAADRLGGLNGAFRLGSGAVPAREVEAAVDIGGRVLKYSRDLVGMVYIGSGFPLLIVGGCCVKIGGTRRRDATS